MQTQTRKLYPVTQDTERELVGHLQIMVDGQPYSVVDWRYAHAEAVRKGLTQRAIELMSAYKIALQEAGYYLDINRKNKVLVVDEEYTILQALDPESVEAKTVKQGQAKKKADKRSLEIDEKALKQALKDLNELIGLEDVKERIKELINFIRVQAMRRQADLPELENSYHMVFTGNPGTGKTTVGRILGNIFKALGLLQEGHLIETDRSGLVSEHVGGTAIKTNALIDTALGGILFVDEAYALTAMGSSNDFGKEALSTLLKRMEDHRDNLIVVFAGYTKEMAELLSSNPGLRSRFKTMIDFEDYTEQELEDIFTLFMRKNKLRYGVGVKKLIRATLAAEREREEHFGNGRAARNLFEESIINQANRLSDLSKTTKPTKTQLSTILPLDIPELER